MLNKDGVIKVLTALQYSEDEINSIVNSRTDVALPRDPDGTFYTADGYAEAKKNISAEAKKAAVEIAAKELRKALGVNTDSKDLQEITKLYAEQKVKEVQTAPEEKEREYQQSIQNLTEKLKQSEEAQQRMLAENKERQITDMYTKGLHAERNPALDEVEWVARLRRTYELVEVDGVTAAKDLSTGQIVKDKYEKPVPYTDVFKTAFESKEGWLKTSAPATTTEPKTTLGVRNVNASPAKASHLRDPNTILAEVERQLGTTKGIKAQQLFTELSRQYGATA